VIHNAIRRDKSIEKHARIHARIIPAAMRADIEQQDILIGMPIDDRVKPATGNADYRVIAHRGGLVSHIYRENIAVPLIWNSLSEQ
jgi:hypothetical protein